MTEDDEARKSLIRLEEEEDVDRRFVAAEAGDVAMQPTEAERHAQIRRDRGVDFYADLLFALTHREYAGEQAEALWHRLIAHREELNSALGRNVGIAVATLDYLTNLRSEMSHPVLVQERSLDALAAIATRDAMTGLWDFATFEIALADCIRVARRRRRTVALLMLDVDNFKAFNDAHGHPVGDDLLRGLAELLEGAVRDGDWACRYGGEEFAIVAPKASRAEAHQLAERIRQRVQDSLHPGTVTVSLGVAVFPADGEDAPTLVERADEALYRAKRSGRNRVVLA